MTARSGNVAGIAGLRATARNAFAQALANRSALVIQVGVMLANDVAWIAFWLLFFHRVGTLHGWTSSKLLLLLSVLTTAGGIAIGLLSNARRVGPMALEGELEGVLALPVSPLAHLLLKKVEVTNLGDLLFGLVLFFGFGSPNVTRTLIFAYVVLTSTLMMVGFLVATGSLAFFIGRNEGGELGFHAMLLLAAYPVDIFAGAVKIILYTAIPAALMASVPAKLIDHFTIGTAVALGAVGILFAGIGWATFTLGLRRYTSGSTWSRA